VTWWKRERKLINMKVKVKAKVERGGGRGRS
jgi:hypothetical protein